MRCCVPVHLDRNLPKILISMPHLGHVQTRLDNFWIGHSTVSYPKDSDTSTVVRIRRNGSQLSLSSRWIRHRCVNCRIRKGNEYPMKLIIFMNMVHHGSSVQPTVQLCDMLDDNVAQWIHETSWDRSLKRMKNCTISCTWRCSYLSAFVTSKSLAPDDASNHRSFDNFTEGTWAFRIERHVKTVKPFF